MIKKLIKIIIALVFLAFDAWVFSSAIDYTYGDDDPRYYRYNTFKILDDVEDELSEVEIPELDYDEELGDIKANLAQEVDKALDKLEEYK